MMYFHLPPLRHHPHLHWTAAAGPAQPQPRRQQRQRRHPQRQTPASRRPASTSTTAMGKPGGGRGKKKNAGVGVDFKRAKHRVGKKLPRAQNATDTSFKSRTLSLAEQSVAADKEGQAVTGRNLTLKAS